MVSAKHIDFNPPWPPEPEPSDGKFPLEVDPVSGTCNAASLD